MIRTKRVLQLGLAAVFVAVGQFSTAALGGLIFSEDFESGLGAWTTLNGPSSTSAAPDPKGQSFVHADSAITRISRGFTANPAATSVKLSWQFYTNNITSSTQRYYGQLTRNSAVPTFDGSSARLAANNLSTYRFLYSNGATQTLDTGVALGVGWHQASVMLTPNTNTVNWTLDSASGSVVNTIAGGVLIPDAVVLGNNVSNGTAGAPDTTAWFDTVAVEQFAPAAGAIGNPVPNGASGVGLNDDLSWAAGLNTSFFDVFFDTNPNPTTLISGANFSATTIDPGVLQPSTTYYWRVTPRNAVGDAGATGAVQSFVTVPEPPTAALAAVAAGALVLVCRRRSSQ